MDNTKINLTEFNCSWRRTRYFIFLDEVPPDELYFYCLDKIRKEKKNDSI